MRSDLMKNNISCNSEGSVNMQYIPEILVECVLNILNQQSCVYLYLRIGILRVLYFLLLF